MSPPSSKSPPESEEPLILPFRQKVFFLLSLLPVLAGIIFWQWQTTRRNQLISFERTTRQTDNVIGLTLALARIPSSSGHEQQVFEYAESWLSSKNLTLHIQQVPAITPSHPPRKNLLALYGDISDIKVLLCTHLDTVPGGPVPGIVNDKLVGRGVVDAKGQAAGFMLALVQLADPRVGLLLVSGEETDHKGMILASELSIPETVTLLNGEPTEGMVASRQKGMLKGVIKVVGRRAHSGYPHLGDSAVHKLLDVLGRLRGMWPGDNGETMNIGVVNGGSAPNVVAGEAEAGVLWRVIDKADAVLQRVLAVVNEYDNVIFEIISKNDALELYVPEQAAREFGVTQVAYNTDVPYYRREHARAIVFGAGSITVAHTENEAVSMSEMVEFGDRVTQMIEELL